MLDFLNCDYYSKSCVRGYCPFQSNCKLECYFSNAHVREYAKKLEGQINELEDEIQTLKDKYNED